MDIINIEKLETEFNGIFMQAVLLHIPKNKVVTVLKKVIKKLEYNGYLYIAVKEQKHGGVESEIKKEEDYGYPYERFFTYYTLEELEQYFSVLGLEILYKDVMLSGNTEWIQIIGQKKK